jgi:hypothetical protein
MEKTVYQVLAEIYDRVGARIILRPYDEIIKVEISSSRVAVLIAHHRLDERASEDRLLSRIMHMREWRAVGDDLIYNELKIEDPTFVPQVVKKFGGVTVGEWTARRAWENDCGTPGSYRTGAPIQAEREREYFGDPGEL